MAIWSAEIKELEKLYESIKGQLPELEKELEQLIRTEDANVILLYSRRCLEVIITDLCEYELGRPRKTEPLKGIIDKLYKQEKVPPHIITSMHGLNDLSTYGTHPKEYDPEQVRPVLINLLTIFKWYLKFKNIGIYTLTENKIKDLEISPIEKKYSIQGSGVLLDYTGPISSDMIELILIKLKQSKDYRDLNKIIAKRVYSIIIECLENISKHSLKRPDNEVLPNPYISVRRQENEIIIIAGNPTSEDNKKKMVSRIDQINNLDETDLKLLYDENINSELKLDEVGAGLGFIIMAIKSQNRIEYSYRKTDSSYTFVEVRISISNIILRKFIIKQTSCSPKINFDPDKNLFEISGESRPPDVPKFYEVILKWLDEFSKHLDSSDISTELIRFDFNFEYFNSLSAKYILDFCKKVANIHSKWENVIIRWHYDEDDTDMLEAGREMSRIAKFPFEYVQKDIK